MTMELNQHAKDVSLAFILYVGVGIPVGEIFLKGIKWCNKRSPLSACQALIAIGLGVVFMATIVVGILLQSQNPNLYRVVGVSRFSSIYYWAQAYSRLRRIYKGNPEFKVEAQQLEDAYDVLYDSAKRRHYNFWGDPFPVLPTEDEEFMYFLVNYGMFYFLWGTMIFAVFSKKRCCRKRTHAVSGLVALMFLEFYVRVLEYDLGSSFMSFTTPDEFVSLFLHLYPAYFLALAHGASLFYVDEGKFRKLQLLRMAADYEESSRIATEILEQLKVRNQS